MEAGSSYLQTMQEGLEETRNKGEEVNWEAESRKTEETSETRGGNRPGSTLEDIESWRNMERDMVKQQGKDNPCLAEAGEPDGI